MRHEPVMVEEVLALLEPRAGGHYCDGTVGAGGHARALLDASAPDGKLLAVDRDPAAVEHSRRALAPYGERVTVVHATFAALREVLQTHHLGPLDGLVLDLGVSSSQLDEPARGFSFQAEGPLDMRMDPSGGESAGELLDRLDERELTALVRTLGEERHAGRVAREIRAACERGELRTTLDLAGAIRSGVGAARSGSIDAATRTFQAIRIAVNDELGQLRALLAGLPDILGEGGRAAILSFHSLEDRTVKQGLHHWSECRCDPRAPACACGGPLLRLLTRKPLRPSEAEVARNPRARSARLRGAERLAILEAA
jgi:16S rRNA (cytosine1402-N4)-methyltransferase